MSLQRAVTCNDVFHGTAGCADGARSRGDGALVAPKGAVQSALTTRVYGADRVETDAEGFLVERDAWTPDIGEAIAHELGFALGPLHWKIINCAREEHASRGRRPSLRQIAASTGVPMGTLHALFPHATSAIITRVAGIPRKGAR